MAVDDAYATVQKYRAVVGKTDSGDDLLIADHLKTCTRLFERETGLFFGQDAEAVDRVFCAKWWDRLDLDYEGNCPGIAITTGLEIKVDEDGDGSFADESAWATTDYSLHPLQANKGPESKPWNVIRVRPGSSRRFPPGGLVQVHAVFGFPSVPKPVEDDIIELCGIWRSENPRSTGRLNELDQIVTASPVALSLVKRIKDAYTRKKVTF